MNRRAMGPHPRATSGLTPAAMSVASPGSGMARVALYIMMFWLTRAWLNLGDTQESGIDAPGQRIVYILIQMFLVIYILTHFRLNDIFRIIGGDLYFSAFFLVILVTLPLSSVPIESLGLARSVLIIYLTCYLVARDLDRSAILNIVIEVIGTIMVLAFVVSVLFPFGRAEGAHLGSWRGLFSHKNGLGEVGAFAAIVLWTAFFTLQRSPPRLYLFASATLICLAMSSSMTGLMAAAGGAVAVSFAMFLNRTNLPNGLKVVLYFFVIGVFGYLVPSYYEGALEALGRDATFTGRDRIWASFLSWADRRPMFGWGLTSSSQNEMILTSVQAETHLNILTPHSMYVQQAVEMGYPMAIAFSGWLLLRLFTSVQVAFARRDTAALMAVGVIVGNLIMGGFEGTVGMTNCVWFGLISLFRVRPRQFAASALSTAAPDRAKPAPTRIAKGVKKPEI